MRSFWKSLGRKVAALGILLVFPLATNADCFVRCTAASGVTPSKSTSITPCKTPPISLNHPDCQVFCQSYCNGAGNVRYCICFKSTPCKWEFLGFQVDAARAGLVLLVGLLSGAGVLGFAGSRRS